MIDRRKFVGLGAILASTRQPALAQTITKRGRVAILSGNPIASPGVAPLFQALLDEMRVRGWEQGRNLVIDARHTDGKAELFASRAAELVALSPDVIVAPNSQAVAAAMAQTSSIPIVMIDVSHPVEAGFIKSLANPGSNVTGVTNQAKDIAGKHVDLLREISPGLERVALLFTPSNAGSVLGMQDQMLAAERAGIALIPIPFERPADLDVAALTLRRERAQAVQVHSTPVMIMNRSEIAQLAIENNLPTIGFYPLMTRDGFLMSYGPDQSAIWRRAATYVDRLLKGESASQLAVEQPTAFRLDVNLKTANSLSLTIPPTLLARADEVIE